MNPLLDPSPDDFVTPRPATHWVDTNVMLEVYSQGDYYAEHLRVNGDPAARWRKIQGSLWMAMALCAQGAVSRSYHYENQRNIIRLAPPESEAGGWTATILYVLGDGGVFEGWHRTITDAGEVGTQEERLSDRERDRLIVRICAAATLPDPIPNIPETRSARILSVLAEVRTRTPGPLVLITRDAQLTREAITAGVDAVSPEAFAARTMTTAQARQMWFERVTMAFNRYVARGSLGGWQLRIRAMDQVRMLVDTGWHPPDE